MSFARRSNSSCVATWLTVLSALCTAGLAVACAGSAAPARSGRTTPEPRPIASVSERPREVIAASGAATGAASGAATEVSEAAPTQAAPTPRAVTIGASGDILCHLKVVRSAREHERGFEHVFGRLAQVIGADEIAFANLETPLSERISPETGDPPVLGAPAAVASALAAAGIDAVSVANNHSYDQMAAGLGDTLAALAQAQVGAVGGSPEPERAAGPLVVERGGVRVAFVAFTERVNRGPAARGPYTRVARYTDDVAREVLARARTQADVVVLSIHWSHDFINRPRLAQRERARLLVEAGADLILGHGPHVLQEVERLTSPRGDAVVAYSLGNLVSNQGLRYWAGRRVPESMHPAVIRPTLRDGAWLRTHFVVEEGRLRVERLEAVPLWTINNFMQVATGTADVLDVHVAPLSEAPEAYRVERLPFIEAALGPAVTIVQR